jgi:D-aspartate ligase
MKYDSAVAGALVIGGDHPGLGVARSLGRRGIPVCVIDDAHSISLFSKYVQRVVRVRNLREERETIDGVLDVGRRFNLRHWVLIPTRDETVAAFSKNRRELGQFFRVPVPEWETIKWAWDKKNTYEMAERLEIPCPETFNVKSADELPDLYNRLPLAIKPSVKENFFYETRVKAWRANTPEELHELFARARRQIRIEEVLLQEIIPGDGKTQYSFCAFFKDGRSHGKLVARRERQHPREFGRAATYVETIDEPIVEELSERFLKAINYYGVVELEFKRDLRDGEFKLLDVNARIWGFHALGAVAGVDFSYLLYSDQLGQSTTLCEGRSGIGWLRLMTDVPAALSGVLRNRGGFGSWLSTLRRARVESVFAMDDPLPSLAEAFMLPYTVAHKYL